MGKQSQDLLENSVKNTPSRRLPPPLPLLSNNACPASYDYMDAEGDDSEDDSQHRTSKFFPSPSNDKPDNPNPAKSNSNLDGLIMDV